MAWSERGIDPRLVAACATALCFSGSALVLRDPLRPFHIGLALVLALACWRDFREAALRTGLAAWTAAFAGLVALQALWMTEPGRYATYAAFIAMACAQMLLGHYMARRAADWLRPLMVAATVWAVLLAILPAVMRELSTGSWPHAILSDGPWGNVNDMATVLIIANLVWLLCARRLSWPLVAVCWIYCAVLDRRAGLFAAMALALGYILCFVPTRRDRLRQAAAWTAALAVTLATTHIGARVQDVQKRLARELAGAPPVAVAPAIPGGSVPLAVGQAQAGEPAAALPPTAISPPPAEASPLAQMGGGDDRQPDHGPAPGDPGGNPVTPAPQRPAPDRQDPARAGHHAQSVDQEQARQARREARRQAKAKARAERRARAAQERAERRARAARARALSERSNSVGVRLDLIEQMARKMRDMPWWQWVAGLGAGQLNLSWRITGAPWASPHFFWWEMYFYLGLAWPLFLGFLFLRADRRGKLALAVLAVAGIASSSLIYLQPLWFFLGVAYARLGDEADRPASAYPSVPAGGFPP